MKVNTVSYRLGGCHAARDVLSRVFMSLAPFFFYINPQHDHQKDASES